MTTPEETGAKAAAAPRRRARLGGWWLIILATLSALALGAGAFVRLFPGTAEGRAFIERQANGMRLGRVGHLAIEGLDGDPWTAFTLRRLTIADRQGVWLDVRDLSVRWNAAALLDRRAEVSEARAGWVSVNRRPLLTRAGKPKRRPVTIQIDAVATRVELAPALASRRGVYDLGGDFTLEPSNAMRGAIAAASVLHPGDFLNAQFDIGHAKAFHLTADAREAKGGALAGALGLAADQPFLLTARANGAISAGQFQVETRVGATSPLEASGVWNKDGGSATGVVQLAASRLLARYQTWVGPVVKFDISGQKAADGFYDLLFAAKADNAVVDARGEADVGRKTIGPHGLAIDAQVADASRIVSSPKMGAARLKGGLGGDASHWILTGLASIDRVSEGPYGLARVSGPVRIESGKGQYAIEATANGAGGAGKGLVAALLGANPRGAAALTVFSDGRILMRRLAVNGAGLQATATGDKTLLGGLSFKGQATVSNLAFAQAGAHGRVLGGWSASQGAAGKPWSFGVDVRGQGLAVGMSEVDRLLGAAPRLRAQADWSGGQIAVKSATLDGAAGSATAAGLIGPASAVRLKLGWTAQGPLELGPLEINGHAAGSGDLAGTFEAPRLDLIADFSAIDLPSLPLRGAHLILTIARGPGGSDGHAALAADSDYGPAKAAGAFRFIPGGLELSGLDVRAGGASATGALALRQGDPSSADLAVALAPGAFLAEGHADGRLKIVAAAGGANADLSLEAADAVPRGGRVRIKTLKLTASGPLHRLAYRASAVGAMSGGPWRLQGDGLLTEDGDGRTVSFSGSGRARRADLRTLTPAELHFGKQGERIKAALSVGGGRADIDYSNLAGAASAKATLANVSLGLLSENLIGRADGTVALAGHGDHLAGDLEMRLTGAGGRDLAGSPPVDGFVKAHLTGPTMTLDASMGNSAGLKASVDLTLPMISSAAPFHIAVNDKAPIKGRFSMDGELKPIWDLAMGASQSLAGHLTASGTLAGTWADPRPVGTASLDNGKFQDADSGLKLDNVTLRATLADNAVDVGQFTATDGAKGTVTGAGRASLARDGASSFRVDLTGFRLLDNDIGKATASGRITVNRAATGKVQLSGALTVDHAQIAPNPPVASGVTPMDVVEVHRPFDVDERYSAAAVTRAAPLELDVTIKAANGVFLKGRGLNLELSLDAHVGGTNQAPILSGAARVVRGDYDFAGQRFQLDDRGVIYLGSTAETIRLNLTATRDDPTLTAVIKVTGTAAKPVITLSSSPALPQDEILSQVLFGTSAAQLSPLEAAQLASTLAGLSGGGGFDLIGGLRNFAHLDRLAIGGNNVTGTTISGGKYLTDRLYLEVLGGSREGEGAQIEWRVKRHLSLVGKATNLGGSQLEVRWRKDY
jgi:translocation and assembly module TamB